MTARPLIFRIHAVQRMFERRISEANVAQILQAGEVIEDYSSEMPHPGGLMLGWRGQRPLHVVMAEQADENARVVITVYEPDPAQWQPSFKKRKR